MLTVICDGEEGEEFCICMIYILFLIILGILMKKV